MNFPFDLSQRENQTFLVELWLAYAETIK
jgi:hypothetical protein